MLTRIFFIIIFLFWLADAFLAQEKQSIKIVTLNVWSGLDYDGIIRMGEYEDEEVREKRFLLLLRELRIFNPDIIFLQEVNPAAGYSSRLADSLGYDKIHQVCNAGFKIGPLGFPVNLKEGNAILARKDLELELSGELKLSGLFGIHGDIFSLHFNQAIFALAGKITVNSKDIILINTHLRADYNGSDDRRNEVNSILDYIRNNFEGMPIILGGDLNAIPSSPEIKIIYDYGFTDSYLLNNDQGYTWNPHNNTNTRYSTTTSEQDDDAVKAAEYDKIPKRIDYIFINKVFGSSIKKTTVVLNQSYEGLYVSDHYGVLSEIDIAGLRIDKVEEDYSDWDAMPILSYDTDFGFGYGAKGFLLNQLGYKESFDITVYNSTKGERWYRFVFSVPDFELRQGTAYPFAMDLIFDYDRMNKNSFFGIGNSSEYEEREYYTREPLEIKLQFGRGITSSLLLQGGLKYKSVRNFNFEEESKLKILGGLSSGASTNYSAFAGLRYDTRNSFINPSKGIVLETEFEYVPGFSFNDISFERAALTARYYYKLFYPRTILATRAMLQGLTESDIPVQNLLSIGGNGTLRGYPQDRFMDKISAVLNAELRFPIYWRFGGIIGMDLGNVWSKPEYLGLQNWSFNTTAGLRFYFDTFIIRLDVGFSNETTALYLNFGHIF